MKLTILAWYVSGWWEKKFQRDINLSIIENNSVGNRFQLMNDDKTLFRAYVNNDDLQYSHYIYKTDLFNSNTIKLSMVLRGYNFLVSNCKNINNSDCYIITAVLSVDNDDHTHQYRNFLITIKIK